MKNTLLETTDTEDVLHGKSDPAEGTSKAHWMGGLGKLPGMKGRGTKRENTDAGVRTPYSRCKL